MGFFHRWNDRDRKRHMRRAQKEEPASPTPKIAGSERRPRRYLYLIVDNTKPLNSTSAPMRTCETAGFSAGREPGRRLG
jgi:hypothetical protein